MNSSAIAIIVGLLAAAGGVLLADSLRDSPDGAGSGVTDLSAIEARLAAIEQRLPPESAAGLQPGGIPPPLLDRLEAIERALRERPATTTTAESGAAPAGSLARIDERLASIEEKLDERAEDGTGAGKRPPRRGKKRVSLAEAAQELELSGQQEDELRRVYDRYHEKLYKLAAGPDGDPEEVKRDVEAARKDPSKSMGIVTKYMPKVLKNIGGFMNAQMERQEGIRKILGPEKANRLNREFDVKEGNLLGLGGEARTEFRMEGR